MSEDDARAAERWHDRMFAEQEALARAMTDVPHDTYHRILHRLRQQHAEAVMHETLDILRGPRVGADALPTAQLEELTADLDAAAVPVITCGVVGHAPDCECATL